MLAPFEDDKHKIAESTDFEAHPDNSPMAILGDAKKSKLQRKLIFAIFTVIFYVSLFATFILEFPRRDALSQIVIH